MVSLSMLRRPVFGAFLALASAASLLPTSLASQAACQADSPATDPARAESMYQKAKSLMAKQSGWEGAAFRFERSARLRPWCDPEVFDSFMLAARLYDHLNKFEAARMDFEAAAENARRNGRIMDAATAYLDAALAAVQADYQEGAVEAVRNAEALAQSPGLSEADRAAIMNRISILRGKGEDTPQPRR